MDFGKDAIERRIQNGYEEIKKDGYTFIIDDYARDNFLKDYLEIKYSNNFLIKGLYPSRYRPGEKK